MADILYLLGNYWPYLVAIFFIGIVIGWWAEGARDPGDMTAWLERGRDRS